MVLLVGLPVLLGLIWFGGARRDPSATAEISIETEKVAELRGLVISRLATVGANKSAETTTDDDGGRSELVFSVPAARLEEAIDELNLVGGVVTRQQVALEQLAEGADSVSGGLDTLDSCLADFADAARGGAAPSTKAIELCRAKVAEMHQVIDGSPDAGRAAVLKVDIERRSTTSMLLVVVVVVLALGLAVMAWLTLRSAREDGFVDLTDGNRVPRDEELYDRRN